MYIVNIGDCLLTGVRGGELKVGVGSRVDSAAAPVSPLSSAPRPLDLRRGRGMFVCGVELTETLNGLTLEFFTD